MLRNIGDACTYVEGSLGGRKQGWQLRSFVRPLLLRNLASPSQTAAVAGFRDPLVAAAAAAAAVAVGGRNLAAANNL